MNQLLRLVPHDSIELAGRAIPISRSGNLERFLDGLRKPGLPERWAMADDIAQWLVLSTDRECPGMAQCGNIPMEIFVCVAPGFGHAVEAFLNYRYHLV